MRVRLSGTASPVHDIWIVLGLAAAAFLFWQFRVIAPIHIREGFFPVDHYAMFYPTYHYGFEELAAGRIPLWSPYTYCGIPFLATLQTGLLYPGNFLFFLLPTELAMGMTAALHTFLAAWFMFLIGREWRWSRTASLIAALTWAFSHNNIWFSGPICFMESAAWIPLMILAAERVFSARAVSGAATLAFAGAMSLLAGGMQVFIYGAYALALFTAVRLWMILRTEGLWAAGLCAGLLALGSLSAGALAAPQILPTHELTKQSERDPGKLPLKWTVVDDGQGDMGATQEGAAASSGRSTPRWQALWRSPLTSFANLWTLAPRPFPGFYFGILPPLIAVAALFGPRSKLSIALFIGAAVAAVLSLGPRTPLFEFYYSLPTGTWFRNPSRFALFVSLSVALLAGRAFVGLQAATPYRRRKAATISAAAAAGVLILIVGNASAAVIGRTALVAFLGLFIIGLAVFSRSRRLRGAGCALLIALILVEFFAAYRNPYSHPQKDLHLLEEHRAIASYLEENIGAYRVAVADNELESWSIQRKYGVLNRIRTLNDYEPLTPAVYARLFRLLDKAPPDSFSFDGRLHLDPARSSRKMLDMLALRFVVADRGLRPLWDAGAASFGLRPIPLGDVEVGLYENPDALPRASLVERAIVARSETEVAEVIADPAFEPRRMVVVEAAGPAEATAEGTGAAALTALPSEAAEPPQDVKSAGSVRILRDEPDTVEIEAAVGPARPSWLVLTDLAFPGWSATVDGETRAILPANLAGRALALSPGIHRVVFRYESRPFRLGCWLALATLLVWGVVFLLAGGKQRMAGVAAARRILPWVVAGGILWALLARTGWTALRQATGEADLLLLVGATVLCSLPMYALDVLSLSRVVAWFNTAVPIRDLARVKAAAYIITLVNYNVGSGGIALWLRRRKGIPFLEALGSILFINAVDVMVLIALMAATLPILEPLMQKAVGVIVGAAALFLAGHFLYWRGGYDFFLFGRFRSWPIFKSFRLATATHYLRLAAIRIPFDLLFILNFWLGLRAFDVEISFLLALAYTPILLFIAVVPVTVAGLGTVQAATLYLFRDHASEGTLLAFSLIFTVVLSAVRALFGIPFFRKVSVDIISGGIVVADPGKGERGKTPSDRST